jgi:hypothetical protein
MIYHSQKVDRCVSMKLENNPSNKQKLPLPCPYNLYVSFLAHPGSIYNFAKVGFRFFKPASIASSTSFV